MRLAPLHESLETIRIARYVLTEDLERQITAEHGVFGEVDLPHAAARDQAGNVEAPDCRVRQVLFGHHEGVILPDRAPSRIVVIM